MDREDKAHMKEGAYRWRLCGCIWLRRLLVGPELRKDRLQGAPWLQGEVLEAQICRRSVCGSRLPRYPHAEPGRHTPP